jgi:hypothetical protein
MSNRPEHQVEPARHGWVRPLPGGAKARCGGPGICPHCQREQRYWSKDNQVLIHRPTLTLVK